MTAARWTVRAITAQELPLFVAVESTPASASRLAAFLEEIFALGESQPAWCFLAFDAEEPVARVIYVGLNVEAGDFVLNGLALPWGADPLPVGEALLRESRKQMGATVSTLRIAVWSDDQHLEPKHALIQAAGWPLVQDRRRYTRQPGAGLPTSPGRLRFQSAEQVGQAAFVAAIAEVTRSTLDQALSDEVARLGLPAAAEKHWDDLTHMDGRTERYELAYDDAGSLVGLIVPQCHGAMGIIGYIGVVPAQRGRGYVKDLLRRGIETLEAREPALTRIVADIDAGNVPMAQALEATGFVQAGAERRYQAP